MDFLYLLLKHTHSGLRWIALMLLLIALGNSIVKSWKRYSARDNKINTLTIYALHLQLVIGLILYFLSPKVIFSAESMSNHLLRFFLVEHISLMLLAIILATVGHSLSKKVKSDHSRHLRISIFFGIALLLILLAIPWPWQNFAAGWF